jgi:hypothetical protein
MTPPAASGQRRLRVASPAHHAVVDFTPIADAHTHAGRARVRTSFILACPTPAQIDSVSDVSCADESCSRYFRRRADTEGSTAMATMAGGGPTAASACRTTFSILDMFLLIRLIQVASASGHHRQKLNLLQVYHTIMHTVYIISMYLVCQSTKCASLSAQLPTG